MSFKEFLEKKISSSEETFVFITDAELNEVEELLTLTEDGKKIYDPLLLVSKASELGYWCEADYNDETGGYVFEKL